MNIIKGEKEFLNNRPLAGYVRVSNPEEQDVESQKYELRLLVASKGFTKEPVWFEDGISGLSNIRPGLEALKTWVKKNKDGVVVAVDSDRFARDPYLFHNIKSELERDGDAEIVCKNLVKTGNEMVDNMSEFIAGIAAKEEHRKIRERTMRGKKNLLTLQSFSHGGQNPYGYEIKVVSGDKVKIRKLFINPDESKIVKQIYHLFIDKLMPINEICRYLDSNKITLPKKNKSSKVKNAKWSNTAVRWILKSRVYIGEWQCGKRVLMQVGDKKKRVWRDSDDPNIIKLTAPKIISKKDFNKAQVLLDKREKKYGVNSPNKRIYLLRGILKCGKCKYRYSGTAGSTLKENAYYRCNSVNNRSISGKLRGCGNISLRMNEIDSMVIDEINKLTSDPKFFLDILESTVSEDRKTQGIIVSPKEKLEEIKKEIGEIVEAKDRLLDNFSRGIIPEEDYLLRLKRFNKEISILRSQKIELEEKNNSIKQLMEIKSWRDEYEKLKNNLINICDNPPVTTSIEENVEMINKFIKEIVVYNDRLDITFKIPFIKNVSVVIKSPSPQAFDYNNLYITRSYPINETLVPFKYLLNLPIKTVIV